jgi:cell surface protein SprA
MAGMPHKLHNLLFLSVVGSFLAFALASDASVKDRWGLGMEMEYFAVDTPPADELPYPIPETYDPTPQGINNPLYLSAPSNVQQNVEYDPESGEYNITETVGDNLNYRNPTYMTFDEYQEYNASQALRDYWREKSGQDVEARKKPLIPKLNINSKLFETIFGGTTVDIRPQGSAELKFGFNVSKIDNPALPENQKTNTTFDFDQNIQMNVTGKIGEKMQLGINYNTEASFDFENQMKLKYEGNEDEIIQLIEAGNVALPLTGSLIQGSQNLFGAKVALKFGRLTVTGIFSQQKSQSNTVETQGGAQVTQFEVRADQYEANRHFFLSQFFRDNYDEWLNELPIIRSPVMINRIEVWVTSVNFNDDSRNIVAFMDLGELPNNTYNTTFVGPAQGTAAGVPSNNANSLYNTMYTTYSAARNVSQVTSTLQGLAGPFNFVNSQDYEPLELATKLNPNEYRFHPQLGYLSLNRELQPNEVLAVAYQYTYGGQVYQVGEFSTDGITGAQALYVKMLKSTVTNPKLPMWDLMMKNVYNIGAYQLTREEFRLDVIYDNVDAGTRTNYLTEGAIASQILLRTMGMDKLNNNNDPYPDGFFDFVEGVSISSETGRVYLPKVEPFGSHLRSRFNLPAEETIAKKYVYQQLYDSTKQVALFYPELNRFLLAGTYKSAGGAVISLGGMNIPQGSVTVTAGGTTLIENQDYTVDYVLGRVTIINESLLQSNTPIRATSESNSLFSIQQKTLGGVHLDYVVSKDFALGATVLNLSERPLTQKVNIGDEPINNTIWGVDGTYRTESRLLTKLVDKIPLINTKAPSSIAVQGEFAHLIPGNAAAISKGGIAYIDDFEGSVNFIDLKQQQSWVLASTPQGQPQNGMFPEGSLTNNIGFGMNRAMINWYILDPLFYRDNALTPDHLTVEDRSDQFTRGVLEQEIFPNRESQLQGQQTNLPVFDVAYYPYLKGPYNYDADGFGPDGVRRASGLEVDGRLKDPDTRWGGIMRPINTPDFEQNNIEFIQFWMMDPFVKDDQGQHSGGDLYFNLGNISEDILRDGRKAFENGLPTPTNPNDVDTTEWGLVPAVQNIINVFDNDPASRPFQDIGMDGLNNDQEREFFTDVYIQKLDGMLAAGLLSQEAYDQLANDPSTDNFRYYRSEEFDAEEASVLDRYKDFNGLENNSPTAEQSGTEFQASNSTLPNVEDINRDNTVSEAENYFQYKVSLRREDMQLGQNYITDIVQGQGSLANGQPVNVNWYQFKIPVRVPEKVVGNIQDFRSIRFLRMFFKDFEDSVVCRFARLELVRGEWRRYEFPLQEPGEYVPDDGTSGGTFDISVVNLEENGSKLPVNYRLPPGITRQQTPNSSTSLRQLNEQSLLLKACGLEDGDARAAFKNVPLDIRSYKRIKMFVHAEAIDPEVLNDGDIEVFMRLGTDFDNNYYEYVVPAIVTLPGATNEYEVWPLLNNIDVAFEELIGVKTQRNRELISDPSVSLTQRYAVPHGPRNVIYVKGNPNLGNVKSVMIGIRNPKKVGPHDGDDGRSKCAEVWVNELRLTDFDNKGGWATTSQANIKLADFATITAAFNYTKFGFGAFDSKPSDRYRQSTLNYDLATTMQLGMFLPSKWQVNVPMYLGYSETFAKPEFNPLDPDVSMSASLADLEGAENSEFQQDSLRNVTETYIKRRSMNFTDVRKQRTGKGVPLPIDISNFSFNYAYNQQYERSIIYETNQTRTYRGGLNYDYKPKVNNVRPFAKLKYTNKLIDQGKENRENRVKMQKQVVDSLKRAKAPMELVKEEEEKLVLYQKRKDNFQKWSRNFLKSPWLKPVKDFNFNYLPGQLGFRTDMDRRYQEQKLRNTTDYADIRIEPTFQKSFLWNREYHFKYDLTQAIKIQYDAFNFGRVDEPEGRVDDRFDNWDHMRDSIWSNVLKGGRTTQYNHATTVNWTLPINKIPWFSWVTATASYTGNYAWNAAPLQRNPETGVFEQASFGNTIQNSQNWQINANMNFTQLYNKVPFLKKINQQGRNNRNAKPEPKPAKPAEGDTTKVEKPKVNVARIIGEQLASILMMVKSANITYSETNGTSLPGYRPRTNYFGIENGMDNTIGFVPFLFGWQSTAFDDQSTGYDIRTEAIRGRWITDDPLQNMPLTQTRSSSLNMRATVEPFNGFRIDVTATRTYTQSISEFFRWDPDVNAPQSFNEVETGNFSMSYLTLGTAFTGNNEDNSSPVFQQFRENRSVISQRLAEQYPDVLNPEGEFYEGYGNKQQDVLIPAFLSAYGVYDASSIETNPFPKIPLPNWRVTYDGIGKIPFVKKFAKTVTFNHAYRSIYSVSSFATNLNFRGLATDPEFPTARDSSGNFVPRLQINTITISEQFSPLFSFDFNFVNSLIAKLEVKTSRMLSFNMANNQLTEVTSEEYIIGAGYTFRNVKFPIKLGKNAKRIVSDVNLRLDFSIRDTRTLIRRMEEEIDQATAGQKLISIKLNADYVISERINLRFYYDATINRPVVSSSFPTENHAAGISLRFTLAQ